MVRESCNSENELKKYNCSFTDQYQLSVDERKLLVEQVQEQVFSFGFKILLISFAKYVQNRKNIDDMIPTNHIEISEFDEEKVKEFLYKNANKSYRIDLRKIAK